MTFPPNFSASDNVSTLNSNSVSESKDRIPEGHQNGQADTKTEMQSSASVLANTFDTSSFAQSEPSQLAPGAPTAYNLTPGDPHVLTTLPSYACAYCGCSSPQSVVQCTVCKKWFCNGQNPAKSRHGNQKFTKGSHIVIHMTMSHHNSLALHPESDMGDTPLECYKCGNKNVFSLGFVAAKEESVVVLLCRLPCAQSKQNPEWDMDHWQPLIEGRHLLSWLAQPPTVDQMVSGVPSIKQISDLEAIWHENGQKSANADSQEADLDEDALQPVQLLYKDGFEYQRTFGPLVQAEANYFHRVKESKILKDIHIKWSLGLNKKKMASFILPSYEFAEFKMTLGDEVKLMHPADGITEAWEDTGYVVKLPGASSEELTIQLKSKNPPMHFQTGFSAELVWKSVPYDRMQDALKRFALDQKSVSKYLYYKLLGKEQKDEAFDIKLPSRLSVNKELELNASQLNAVQTALKNPLTLIQGPPGTGKTVTSATIVYQICQMNHTLPKKKRTRVLVCAPSNVAVDHLTLQLSRLGLNVVRVLARGWACDNKEVEDCSLDSIVAKVGNKRLKKLIRLRNEMGELSDDDYKEYSTLIRIKEATVLAKAEVICCTCVTAGNKLIPSKGTCTVLIDESTQATEPECLIPIVKGAKQVILVGDHQQLGPVIVDPKVNKLGLGQSLFERLILLGNTPIRLEVQYRMHPSLSEFSSNMFYEGSLHNGVSADQRSGADGGFPWPIKGSPLMFWASFGTEELSSSGVSYLNRTEAMNCFKVVTEMFSNGVKPEQIGIVTPYQGQREFISTYMLLNSTAEVAKKLENVEVVSVDAFQGREKDFIIFSCVRSNNFHQIGFLRDPRRLNVALTRAKYGIIIVGNPITLAYDRLWSYLLEYYRDRGCLVEGQLGRMRISSVQLGKARYSAVKQKQRRPNNSLSTAGGDTATLVSYEGSAFTPGMPDESSIAGVSNSRASLDLISENSRDVALMDKKAWPTISEAESDDKTENGTIDEQTSRSVIESFTKKFADEFTF